MSSKDKQKNLFTSETMQLMTTLSSELHRSGDLLAQFARI